MTYYCTYCERTVDEDELEPIIEWYGEDKYSSNSSGWYEEGAKCPYCGNDDGLEEVEECSCCGEDFGKESCMIHVGDYWYCKDCAEEVAAEFIDTFGMTDECKASLKRRGERYIKMKAHGFKMSI